MTSTGFVYIGTSAYLEKWLSARETYDLAAIRGWLRKHMS